MMGEIDVQGCLFTGDQVHMEHVGRDTFYGWLGLEGPRVFPDADFKQLYVLDNGRPSTPPSQLMRMTLLQWYEGTSDFETVERAKYDLRWKVALGLEDHEGLCAKSTLQMFRARLLLHDLGRELLARSARVCREAGVIRCPRIRAALDTSPIIGRGAVKDTYNLVADGIVKLLRALACFESFVTEPPVEVAALAASLDLSRYFSETSLKGGASLNWDDEDERVAFLTELVADARRAQRAATASLADADPALDGMRCAKRSEVEGALALLGQLVEQDIEVEEDGEAHIKKGVAKDRIPSVHDPEMRHGRKSARKRFDGHKGELVVDADSGVILDASVKAGNAHDADGSLQSIERAEATLKYAFEGAVEEVLVPVPEEVVEESVAPVLVAVPEEVVEQTVAPVPVAVPEGVVEETVAPVRVAVSEEVVEESVAPVLVAVPEEVVEQTVAPVPVAAPEEVIDAAVVPVPDTVFDAAPDEAVDAIIDAARDEKDGPAIEATLGDCAYGTAKNRREFSDAGRRLDAKQAALHNRGRFTKEDFPVDKESGARTCPAGHEAQPHQRKQAWNGEKVYVNHFFWPADVCANCPLRDQCLGPQKEDAPPRSTGRSVSEHPEEALLAQARAQQKTGEFKDTYRERQTVEHRLARMMQLGARQARYIGRAKSQLQWLLTATVANLTLAIKAKNKKGGHGKDENELNSPLASIPLLYALYNRYRNKRPARSQSRRPFLMPLST